MMTRGFHSIHNRLFLLFLFFMLGMLIIVSGLYYKRSSDQYHDKVSEIAQKNVSQSVELFDLLLSGYDSLSKSITNSFDLERLLTAPEVKNSAVSVINERSITNLIGAIYYSRQDILAIHVTTDSGKIYSYTNYMNVIDPEYRHASWYRELIESSGEMLWFGVYPNSLVDQVDKHPVFAFGRRLFDLTSHKPIGSVLIEMDPKPILSSLQNLSLGPHSQVFILSKTGQVVASTEPPPDASKLQDIPRPTAERDVIVDQRMDRLVVASNPPLADWTIVSMTPNRDLNVGLAQTQHYLLIVISAAIVLSTLIATVVSKSISSPLKRLIREMKQVEIGNFRGTLNVKSYEEINILVSSFNQMVLRIGELIERVKLSSISEKNAELHALQTQINPHFLYNTLDMIYWMLDEKGDEKLGEIVLALSRMFRYSSHWEEGADVTLRRELEQIHDYLTIIEIRLEGRLKVEIDVASRWMDIRLPKMTLQPIIENAVKYGLESLNRPGILRVYSELAGNRPFLVVEDNGIGIEQAKLKGLQRSLKQNVAGERKTGGIGLQNVQQRLIHAFGEGYGIDLQSTPGKGTKVLIGIPLPQEGGYADEYFDR